MNKIINIILLFIIGLICSIYIIIPKEIKVTKIAAVKCTLPAGNRFFVDTAKWNQWWPKNSNLFQFKQAIHQPVKKLFNGYSIQTKFEGEILNGEIVYAQVGLDSMAFFWKYNFISSSNPFQRVKDYYKLTKLKENINELSNHLKIFLESTEKVYGMKIVKSIVTDTSLVSTKVIFPYYPSDENIYEMIGKLESYCKLNGAKILNAPMINITVLDSAHFQTMAALPIDIKIKETAEFTWKRMIAGNILISEVRGGDARVKEAMLQMHYYITDYHLTSPAIPFMSLVTNRRIEKDSTKWITRIYYPVM